MGDSLNTRGLILYMLGILKENEENHRVRNVEVSKVLENLAENYKKEFPFLIHYKEIKELYDKLATNKGILEYEIFSSKTHKTNCFGVDTIFIQLAKKNLITILQNAILMS